MNDLDRTFTALADPTRRAILARLVAGEASVGELAAPFGLRQPTITRHLQILEEAGLIETRRDGTRRPRRLVVGGALTGVDDWLRPFRARWERRFDNLAGLVEATSPKPPGAPR